MKKPLSRRTFLKGSGVSIALPFLECMIPKNVFAQALPKYLISIYNPYGAYMGEDIAANTKGADRNRTITYYNNKWPQDFSVWATLQAIESDLITFGRVDNTGSDYLALAHQQAIAGYVFGHKCTNKNGNVLAPNMDSFDQYYANAVGNQTPIRNLNVAMPNSWIKWAAPINNSSWRNGQAQPVKRELDDLFKTLFGSLPGGVDNSNQQLSPQLKAKLARRQSILDRVKGEISTLEKQIGASDKQLLEQHLESIRATERSIANALDESSSSGNSCQKPAQPANPQNSLAHFREVGRLLELAMVCDLTRVATYMLFEGEKSVGHAHRFGVTGYEKLDYHAIGHGKVAGMSHAERRGHMNRADKEIHQVYVELVQRFKNRKNGMGQSLLNQSVIMMGSGMSLAEFHQMRGIPLLVAGQAGGALTTGRRIQYVPFDKLKSNPYTNGMPLARVQLALLQKLGANVSKFNSIGTSPAPQI